MSGGGGKSSQQRRFDVSSSLDADAVADPFEWQRGSADADDRQQQHHQLLSRPHHSSSSGAATAVSAPQSLSGPRRSPMVSASRNPIVSPSASSSTTRNHFSTLAAASPTALPQWLVLHRELAAIIQRQSPRTRARLEGCVNDFELAAFGSFAPSAAALATAITPTAAAAAAVAGGVAASNLSAGLSRLPGARVALARSDAELLAGGVVFSAADSFTDVVACPWAMNLHSEFAATTALGASPLLQSTVLATSLDGRLHMIRCGEVASADHCGQRSQVNTTFGGGASCGSLLGVSCHSSVPGVFLTCGGDGAVQLWQLPVVFGGDGGDASDEGQSTATFPMGSPAEGSDALETSLGRHSSAYGGGGGSILDASTALPRTERVDGNDCWGSGGSSSGAVNGLPSMILDEPDSPRSSLLDDDDDDDENNDVEFDSEHRGQRRSGAWTSSTASEGSSGDERLRAHTAAQFMMGGGGAGGGGRSPLRAAAVETSSQPQPHQQQQQQQHASRAAPQRSLLVRLPGDRVNAVAWMRHESMAEYAICGSHKGRVVILNSLHAGPVSEIKLQSATSVTSLATSASGVSGGGSSVVQSCCTTANGFLHILDHRVVGSVATVAPSPPQTQHLQQLIDSSHFGSLAVNSKRKRCSSCTFVDVGGLPYVAVADESHKLRLFDLRNHHEAPTYMEFPTSLGKISAVPGIGGNAGGLPRIVAVPQHADTISLVDVMTMKVLCEARRLHGGKLVAASAAIHLGTFPMGTFPMGAAGVGKGATATATALDVVQVFSGSIGGVLSEVQFGIASRT